jgi:hypothetical protein
MSEEEQQQEQTGSEQGGADEPRGEADEQTEAEQGGADSGIPAGAAEEMPQSEEEVRRRIEEQIRNLRVQDLMVESVVSVLNLTARRIAKEDERDLEQARVGIDAVRAWVDLLPDDAATQIRNALSELQMLYAQAADGGEGEAAGPEGGPPKAEGAEAQQQPPRRGAEPPPRLWTPPGSN